MAPLKPLANFNSKHFSFLVPIDPSSNSKSIVAKTNILLPPSLQDGSNKSLFIVGASSSGIAIGAKKLISFDSNPIVPKLKKARTAKWELNKMFQDIWVAKLHWLKVVMGPNGKISIVKCEVCNSIEKRDKSLSRSLMVYKNMLGNERLLLRSLV